MDLLRTEHLSHIFPDGTKGITDISVGFSENEFVVLAGKNGSGKTVLMMHLNGLLKPTSGRVLYHDQDIGKNLRIVRQRVGLVFQEPEHQILGQTVEDDVAFGPENLGFNRAEAVLRAGEALDNLGIGHLAEKQPFRLSGGEKRKVALAGIVAMRPEIIICDEPFAGLDLPGVRMILESLLELHAQGHTIIVITHDILKVLAHASRIVIIENGSIAEDGTPESLVATVESYGIRGLGNGEELSDMTWLK